MGAMQGKRGLIMGVANDRSIAWGIAKAMHEAGAELALPIRATPLAPGSGHWPKASDRISWWMWT